MEVKIDDNIEEMTPEQYVAYKKAKALGNIASSIEWIGFCFMLACCQFCSK